MGISMGWKSSRPYSCLLLGRVVALARCGLLLQTEYRGLSVCLSR